MNKLYTIFVFCICACIPLSVLGFEYSEDLTGGGTPSASSETADAYKAVNDNVEDWWDSTWASALPQWFKYDFGEAIVPITKFRIYVRSDVNGVPFGDFLLEGSTNDSNWDLLVDDTVPNTAGWYEWEFGNTTHYRYYRVYCTSSNYNYPPYTAISIPEIELMSYAEEPPPPPPPPPSSSTTIPVLMPTASSTFLSIMGFDWGNVIAFASDNTKMVVGSGMGLVGSSVPWIVCIVVVVTMVLLIFSAFKFFRH